MDFSSLPKIELHLHLDSSLSFDAAQKIDPHMTRELFNNSLVAPPKCSNLIEYLDKVSVQVDLLQTGESLITATKGLINQLEKEQVIYAEVRFAPLLHLKKGLNPDQIIETVLVTIKEFASSVKINVILCNLRDFTESQSMQTVQLVKQYLGKGIVGLDLAGDEKGFPLDEHVKAFQFAHQHQIPVTAHAGEACGPDSVWDTISKLKPSRIGHGVRSYEDPNLLTYLKEHKIHLEVCPTSNIQTNVYESYGDHTISRLLDMGISLSVNTDGRTTSNVSLSEEYRKLHKHFGWDIARFRQCNLNAVEAAFIPNHKKVKLKKRIKQGYSV